MELKARPNDKTLNTFYNKSQPMYDGNFICFYPVPRNRLSFIFLNCYQYLEPLTEPCLSYCALTANEFNNFLIYFIWRIVRYKNASECWIEGAAASPSRAEPDFGWRHQTWKIDAYTQNTAWSVVLAWY